MTGARTPESRNQMSKDQNASESPPSPSRCSKVVWQVPTHETPFGTMLETGLEGLTILMYRGQHGWKTLEAALAYARLSHQVYEKDLVGILHDFSVREVCAVDLDCGKWRTLYASTDSEVSHP
jgi:hypothetical protein